MARLYSSLLVPSSTGELVSIDKVVHTRHTEEGCVYITSGNKMDMDVEMTIPFRPATNGTGSYQPEPYFTKQNPPSQYQRQSSDLLTIEEFERQFPRQPKTPKKLVPLSTVPSDPTIVHKLNNLCQLHGMLPQFDIQEVGTQSFIAKVRIGEQVVNSTTPFHNKKLAKEDVCRLALPILEQLDLQRSQREKAAERLKARDQANNKVRSDFLNAENWIGVLMSYTQKHHLPFPSYTELRTESIPYEFACTISIPSLPIPFFGSTDDLYPSKSEAKKAAARGAVLWLRNVGKLSPTEGMEQNNPCQLKPNAVVAMGVGNGGGKLGGGGGGGGREGEGTLPEQVHNLVAALGFRQPCWQASPCVGQGGAGAGPFYSMAAVFHPEDALKERRLSGDVGRVENVYGRKKAKERCCVEVLRVLEEIRDGRMTEG